MATASAPALLLLGGSPAGAAGRRGAGALTGNPAMLAAPLVIGLRADAAARRALIGEDRNNPPEAVVPQLEADTTTAG